MTHPLQSRLNSDFEREKIVIRYLLSLSSILLFHLKKLQITTVKLFKYEIYNLGVDQDQTEVTLWRANLGSSDVESVKDFAKLDFL